MVMSCTSVMGDVLLRQRLTALWRRIEDAHYSYLETDDSPEKLQQKDKLEGFIMEYLTLAPHECKFGLAETAKVFQRTINELSDFSAYRAGLGWAALARYASNLLAQPWRKEYKVIRLYCGYYKHEVEANMVGAESLLQALGYRPAGLGRLALHAPVCPDTAAAVSRDALIAHAECQIMCQIWEAVWGSGARVTWAGVARERAARPAGAAAAAARLAAAAAHTARNTDTDTDTDTRRHDGSEIYSNIPASVSSELHRIRQNDTRYHHNDVTTQSNQVHDETLNHEEPITPVIQPYMMPSVVPQMMYLPPQTHEVPAAVGPCGTVPVIGPYGVPYYYPVQPPYMIPTPVYAPIKQAMNVPINGYPPLPQYRYPSVPTAQLIEIDTPSIYENGKFERHREEDRCRRRPQENSRRNSTSKSGFSDVTLPSLPRSDTQPALSKAREDGMGTYESWDYVFRNLSSKDQPDGRSRYSPSLDRDSRTLDRLDREERRAKYQPTTLDLEDGLQALNLDRSYDEDAYRTAKVNENLMRMKQERELKKAKQLIKKQSLSVDEKKKKPIEPVPNPQSDALISMKVASDKVRLLTKKDVKYRKEVLKQQNLVNGVSNTAEVKKVKKPTKSVAVEVEKPKNKPLENGLHNSAHSSKNITATSANTNYDLKAQLIVTLDESESLRRSPPKQLPQHNGDRERSLSRTSQAPSERQNIANDESKRNKDKWECGTCTYLNKGTLLACEMCGKSKRGPEIQPLTSGGRECPTCTLVNKRNARVCDACGTSLEHCPTYI